MTVETSTRVTYSFSQKELKGEDRVLVQTFKIGSHKCLLVIVCDGHGGHACAAYAAQHFGKFMEPHLPVNIPNWKAALEIGTFADQLRSAVAHAAHETDKSWRTTGSAAGTTLTLAIITGQLLTVANVGDSTGIVDTGGMVHELTLSHRLNDNKSEQQRLRAAGLTVAPLGAHLEGPARQGEMGVGPLRLWPGGLCVGRSIGDHDASGYVLPLPHIRQLLAPREGIRLLLASDGLWDLMSHDKAAKVVRKMATEAAAAALVGAAAADKRISDDVSVVVVDLLPPASEGWPQIVTRYAASNSSGGGGCCGGGKSAVKYDEPVHAPPKIKFLADVDAMSEFPELLPEDVELPMDGHFAVKRDLTVHGGGTSPYLYRSDSAATAAMAARHADQR